MGDDRTMAVTSKPAPVTLDAIVANLGPEQLLVGAKVSFIGDLSVAEFTGVPPKEPWPEAMFVTLPLSMSDCATV